MTYFPSIIEGWETQDLTSGGWGTSGTAPTVTSDKPHSGSYSLKFNPVAAYSGVSVNGSNTLGALSAYVWFDSLPANNMVVMQVGQVSGTDHRIFFAINASTGKWRLGERINSSAITYGSDGPTVETGKWIKLHLTLHTSDATYHYTDGWVDDTAMPQCAFTGTGGGALGVPIFGNRNELGNSTETMTWYLDDILYYQSAFSYPSEPFNEYEILMLRPNGDGTHSTAGSFTDDASNSPPASVYDRLDELVPSTTDTDFVSQTTLGASDYLEITFEDMPTGADTYLGVGARSSKKNGSGTQISKLVYRVIDGASSWVVSSGAFISSNFQFKSSTVRDSTDPEWTTAAINALLGRIGYSDDATPTPSGGYFTLHVAYETLTGADHWAWADSTEDSWQAA